jgi:hypothetical protein
MFFEKSGGDELIYQTMLVLDLGFERAVYFTVSFVVGIIPESVVAMPVVGPARVVNDGIKAHAVYIDAACSC